VIVAQARAAITARAWVLLVCFVQIRKLRNLITGIAIIAMAPQPNMRFTLDELPCSGSSGAMRD